ncbi:MAG: HAMP domain-containing histidine kinase, partial [Bacteroidales bacterium]|nr:HAMP domain-containing histidine kinase [Bacteroidales bacterium]
KGTIHILLEQNKNFVEIQIADTGCGIAEAERPHIFEPRFTTKSGGMGLGLSLVKKMVENAEGSIEFDSEENKGTLFTMRFPNTYPS